MDGLSTVYQELLSGSYDCVDRIVLNAYCRVGRGPGGFRAWWRAVTGSDETLENAHLMRMAGRFSRRIRGYAKAHNIPVIDCLAGARKHDIAEEYLAKTKVTQGLFLVLVGRAQAPVWDVRPNHHIERKKPMPYVNHYSFHHPRPRVGPCHDQNQRPSALSRPGDLERPRVRGLPGTQGGARLHQGRKLLHSYL